MGKKSKEVLWNDGVFRSLPKRGDDHEARNPGLDLAKILDGCANAAEIAKVAKSGSLSLNETSKDDRFERKRHRQAEVLRLADAEEGHEFRHIDDDGDGVVDRKYNDYDFQRAPVVISIETTTTTKITVAPTDSFADLKKKAKERRLAKLGPDILAAIEAKDFRLAGELLGEAKAKLLDHGQFVPWLESCGIHGHTAQRCLKTATPGR